MSRLWVWDGECGGLIDFYKPAVVGINSAVLYYHSSYLSVRIIHLFERQAPSRNGCHSGINTRYHASASIKKPVSIPASLEMHH